MLYYAVWKSAFCLRFDRVIRVFEPTGSLSRRSRDYFAFFERAEAVASSRAVSFVGGSRVAPAVAVRFADSTCLCWRRASSLSLPYFCQHAGTFC